MAKILITSLDVEKETRSKKPAPAPSQGVGRHEYAEPLRETRETGLVACGYLRVSTYHQDPAPQLAEIKRLVEVRGYFWSGYYEDTGSGKDEERAKLKQLLEAARRREFNILVVYKIDRLSRSLRKLLHVVEELTACNVKLVSATEGFDSMTPFGMGMVGVLGALAQMDTEMSKERCAAGRKYAQEHGTKSGRPFGHPRREFNTELAVELFERRKPDGSRYSYPEIRAEVSRGLPRAISLRTLRRFFKAEGLKREKPGNKATAVIKKEGENVGRSE